MGLNGCDSHCINAANCVADYLYALMSQCNVSSKGEPESECELAHERSRGRFVKPNTNHRTNWFRSSTLWAPAKAARRFFVLSGEAVTLLAKSALCCAFSSFGVSAAPFSAGIRQVPSKLWSFEAPALKTARWWKRFVYRRRPRATTSVRAV